MKQAVMRKTLKGVWTEYKFSRKGRSFFVKNYTNGDILVSFLNDGKEDESFKIKSGIGEEVAISFDPIDRKDFFTDTIFVKGTGEVEVEALHVYETIDDETVSDGVLTLADYDRVSGDTAQIDAAEIDGDTMII